DFVDAVRRSLGVLVAEALDVERLPARRGVARAAGGCVQLQDEQVRRVEDAERVIVGAGGGAELGNARRRPLVPFELHLVGTDVRRLVLDLELRLERRGRELAGRLRSDDAAGV